MASIIKANINLNEIPKEKIYKGKKGSYLPITITINDEVDNYGNQGPVVVEQSNVKCVGKKYHRRNMTSVISVQIVEMENN